MIRCSPYPVAKFLNVYYTAKIDFFRKLFEVESQPFLTEIYFLVEILRLYLSMEFSENLPLMRRRFEENHTIDQSAKRVYSIAQQVLGRNLVSHEI